MTLSDTHLVLLSAAAQRDDHLLPRPDRLFGTALTKLGTRLLRAGLVEEVPVTVGQPHWSVKEAGEQVGLRITAGGLAAIGISDERTAEPATEPEPPRTSADPTPRPGTKRALLIALLGRETGATVGELQVATGWLPHTVRAALTGLRKADLTLTKSRNEAGVTHYRLGEPARQGVTTRGTEVDDAQ